MDGISPASMERFQTYLWPGNIRELRTVLERAILVVEKLGARDRRGAPRRTARGRQLSPDRAAGLRRDGRGLARETSPPGASGGREVDPLRGAFGRCARTARTPVSARSASDGHIALAAHGAAFRFRGRRPGELLLRDGAARRPGPARDRQTLRAAAGRACRHASAAGMPFARRGARARPGPS